MSDISEAQTAINALAKAIAPKLFKGIPALAVAINKIASIESSAKQADALKTAAQKAQKTAEEKLSVLQNTVEKAKAQVADAQKQAQAIEAAAQNRASEIVRHAADEAVKTEAGLKGKLDDLRAQISKEHQTFSAIKKDVEVAALARVEAEKTLREIREKAQALGRG